MNLAEYASYDAMGLADLVRRGDVTAAELEDLAHQAIEALNPQVNAVIGEVPRELASIDAGADAPFSGVPFLLKDLGHGYAGVPSDMGSRMGRGFITPSESELARRFRASGLVAVGRTNTPEFGLSGTTEPVLHGPSRNPWDLGVSSGGSSGGASAAVAAGIVPMAHGSDAGGSIRIPAGWTGLVGLKPSRGLVPKGPDASDATVWLSMHFVLSRSVRDSAAMLDAMAGPALGDYVAVNRPERSYLETIERPPQGLRIALCRELPGGLTTAPECVSAVEATARICQDLGHHVEEAAPQIDVFATHRIGYELFLSRVATLIAGLEKATGRKPGPDVLEAMTLAALKAGDEITMEHLFACLKEMEAMTVVLDRFMADYDILLTPAVTRAPFEIGYADPDRGRPYGLAYWEDEMPYYAISPLHNITGLPALVIPSVFPEGGVPLGSQLGGAKNADGLLFALAAQIEAVAPWTERRPPVHVAHP